MGVSDTAVVLAPDLAARGGAERVAVAAAAVFAEAGFRSVVLSPGTAGDGASLSAYFGLDLSGVEFRSLPADPSWTTGLPTELREVLAEHRWSAAARALNPAVLFAALFYSEPAPVGRVSYYYTHFPHRRSVRTRGRTHAAYMDFTRRLHRLLVGRGRVFPGGYTRVFANSDFSAAHVRERWAVDADVLAPPCSMLAAPIDGPRKPWILSVGRFQDRGPGAPHKGQDALIEAVAGMPDLVAQGWELHLVGSVGSTAELARLQRLADGLPVRFHPDATFAELSALAAQASIFWHAQGYGTDETAEPQAQEHFGITVVEAMSAGLLPVVYDTAGPHEIVGPVAGAGRWRTLDELRSETLRLVDLGDETTLELRVDCVARAREFDGPAFAAALRQALDHDR